MVDLHARIEEGQHLLAIRENPSWPIVREILGRKLEILRRRYESPEALDAHDLNYTRGFISGLRYVLDVIENGDKQLARALAQAQEVDQVVRASD